MKLSLAWDGTAFQGWQSQGLGERTVQDTLLEALQFYGSCLRPVAAGRTDSGVHALEMSAHVDVQHGFKVQPDKMARALNAQLPADLRVLHSSAAPPNFHARHSCCARRYLYRIERGAQPHPLERERALYIWEPLDLERLKEATKLFVGQHDFAAFATREERQTVRNLFSLEWKENTGFAPILELHLHGESFLRHMVRAIVGTLLEVGVGKRRVGSVRELLEGASRVHAGRNVPAHGLFFAGADYEDLNVRGSISVQNSSIDSKF